MCGRFTYKLTWEESLRLYRLALDQPARNTQARYNACPTDPVGTIVEHDGKRDLVSMRWGLIPRWRSNTKVMRLVGACALPASILLERDQSLIAASS